MSDSGGYLDRLAALNHAPLQNVPESEAKRDKPVRKPPARKAGATASSAKAAPDAREYERSSSVAATRKGGITPLTDLVDGVDVDRDPWGSALLVTTRVWDLTAESPNIARSFDRHCGSGTGPLMAHLASLCGSPPAARGIVFLDIETTGLGNTPLFLIGLMVAGDTGLVIRQYLARDYGEEAAVTALFAEEIVDKSLLITFNGKSFDLPYIEARAAAHGVPLIADVAHLDLLHEARRAWRGRTPNHKLQTLERHICGRDRHDDIPGAEVPEAYHAFVRTGDARDLARIMEHNRLDLLTLADLLNRIPDAHWLPRVY